MIDISQKPESYAVYPRADTSSVTIRRTTNVLFDGMGTRQQGWGVYFTCDDSRLGFYATKREALADVSRYNLKVV